jgi:hypothetical protein
MKWTNSRKKSSMCDESSHFTQSQFSWLSVFTINGSFFITVSKKIGASSVATRNFQKKIEEVQIRAIVLSAKSKKKKKWQPKERNQNLKSSKKFFLVRNRTRKHQNQQRTSLIWNFEISIYNWIILDYTRTFNLAPFR